MCAAVHKRCLLCLAVLLLSGSLATAQETPAEKARKVLDAQITLNFSGQDLQEVVNHLREKTGINFVIDEHAQPGINQFPFGGLGNPAPQAAAVEIKSENARLQTALQRLLHSHHLTYVILENSVLITSDEIAATRQLTQRINVRIQEVPLQKALKDVLRGTPVNFVLDPRVIKDAQSPVSLELDGITVETAIRLLAELGGLKSVRVDNVLFVTSEVRAEKMMREQPPVSNPTNPGLQRIFGGGFGMPIGGFARPVAPPPPPAPK